MMNKEIHIGDRIFARLTMGRKVIFEFMMNRVGSMADLMAEVRQMTGGLRGLGRLQVRNQSRGWASTSNLMFCGAESNSTSNIFGRVSPQDSHMAHGASDFESGSLFSNEDFIAADMRAQYMG